MSTGEVLSEVNGRPVFVVRSAFAFYRDVGLGDQGPDVSAIQETLERLGYSLDVDGHFGSQTEAAVRQWYSKNGYTPATRDGGAHDGSSTSRSEPGQASPETGNESEAAPATSEAFIPFSEILGVTVLPAVSLGELAVGTAVGVEGETDIALGSTTTTVTFEAVPADLTSIAQGDEVSIDTGGSVVKGTVSSIEAIESGSQDESMEGQSEQDDTQSRSTVTVVPSEPLQMTSTEVRVVASQIVVAEDALLVPAIAVIDRGDTHQVVVVSRSDGEFAEVEVTLLGTLDGKAAIVPLRPSSLQEGDQVRVGSS